jgi:hypothetical protein
MERIQYNTKWKTIDQNEVLRLHSKHYTINDICLELRTTEYVIDKILKLHGLKGGTKLDRLKDKYQDIIKFYQKSNRLSLVAREFNITEHLVEKVLELHNISKREVIKELDTNEVIDYYKKTYKVKLVADKLGVSNSVILKILHKNNVRVSKIKYSDKEIIDHYLKVKTIKKVCDDLKISDTKVSDVLKTNNIELITFRRKRIGDVYGKLTIIEEVESKITSKGNKIRQFMLWCECGELIKRSSHYLDKGKTWHCGCVTKERIFKKTEEERIKIENYHRRILERQENKKIKEKKIKEKKIKEKKVSKYVPGYKKDKLTIISVEGEHLIDFVVVLCECGTQKRITINNLIKVKSCGCLQMERSTKHGLAPKNDDYKRKWYDRWRSMIRRCYNPKDKDYNNYGGRGITVCGRWRELNGVGCRYYIDDIHNILGLQPSPEHSLDRINNDGPYEITNLRWATNLEQSKNRRISKSKK